MQMNSNDIVQLISNLGFPIVCCGVLFYTQSKFLKEIQEDIKELTQTLAAYIKIKDESEG